MKVLMTKFFTLFINSLVFISAQAQAKLSYRKGTRQKGFSRRLESEDKKEYSGIP
jgi:hypothetical protein